MPLVRRRCWRGPRWSGCWIRRRKATSSGPGGGAQQAAPPPTDPRGPGSRSGRRRRRRHVWNGPDRRLKKLGELHDSGVLTDEQFDAEKEKLI